MLYESNKPSTAIKNQNIEGLEEWLKNNKPTVIPRGVSTQTGYSRAIEPKPKAEPKPKPKAEPKPKPVKIFKPKPVKQPKPKKEPVITRMSAGNLFSEFKEKSMLGDRKKLADAVGVAKNTIRNWINSSIVPINKYELISQVLSEFKYRERRAPKKNKNVNADLRLEAIEKGLTEFMGHCDKHGFTLLKLRTKRHNILCPRCTMTNKPKKMVFPSLAVRVQYNQSLAKKVVDGTFIGYCDKHGETNYVVKNGKYRCVECKKNNLSQQKTKSQVEKNTCVDFNRKQREIAVEKGATTFIGKCPSHGESIFKVCAHTYRCTSCVKEYDDSKRRRKEPTPKQINQKENRDLMNEIIKLNSEAKSFMGNCLTHGIQKFYVKKTKNTKSGVTFACSKCK